MGNEINSATTSKALNSALLNEFPEVETATIISNFDEALLSKPDGAAFRVKMSGINPNFFEVFSIPVVKGNVVDLDKPNTAFITLETAQKFFGEEDPVGKVLSTGMDHERKKFTIVGLVEKIPENSHFDFDMLYSNVSQSWYRQSGENWLDATFYNYVLLKPEVDYQQFEKKFNDYALSKIAIIIKNWKNMSTEEWYKSGDKIHFEFQPMRKIHLISSLDGEYKKNGNIIYVYIFLVAGILILLISVINFSNLYTIKSLHRAKETGIRKVIGAGRQTLIIQFLIESCMVCTIAFFLSLIFVFQFAYQINGLTGNQIINPNKVPWAFIVILLSVSVASGLLAGAFPSLFLSKLSPVNVLSSTSKLNFKGVLFKDVLIVAQFAISILVILGTFVINHQLDYLQNKNLGFNKENIVVLRGTENLSWKKNHTLKQELNKLGTVKSSSSSHYIPSSDCSYYLFAYETDNNLELAVLDVLPCDHNYESVYRFEMLEGNFFDESFSKESRKIILNETAVKSLKMENPIGRILIRSDVKYEIIGIAKDFHYTSKQHEIRPLCFVQLPDVKEFWSPIYCSVLIDGSHVQSTVSDIKNIWQKISPGTEFNFSFFDKEYNNMYRLEIQTKKVFSIFSIIALSLSCFGLFGFVKYLIETKTKEIGIRKVNGARNQSIFVMLSKSFGKPIILALFIASPIGYFLLEKWLQRFAYRVNIEMVYFLLTGIITIGVVLITVGWLSWRAATKNPVEALRYE